MGAPQMLSMRRSHKPSKVDIAFSSLSLSASALVDVDNEPCTSKKNTTTKQKKRSMRLSIAPDDESESMQVNLVGGSPTNDDDCIYSVGSVEYSVNHKDAAQAQVSQQPVPPVQQQQPQQMPQPPMVQQQQQMQQPVQQQQHPPQRSPQPSPPMHPQPAPSPQRSPMPLQPMMSGTPQRPPLTPQRPPLQHNQMMNGGGTTALAVQDPYSVSPQELSRYEAIFPQYAQPDDANNPSSPVFVHGAAAVELFSKSGMDRESLKTIWTMVDDPIDNKLDPLEFAVAMHLIVCITKKGLPTPPSLPGSLSSVVQETRARRAAASAGVPQPGMPQQGVQQPQQGMGQQGVQQPQQGMGQQGVQQPQQGMGQQGVQQPGQPGVGQQPASLPSPTGMQRQPLMNGGMSAIPPPQQMGMPAPPLQMGMQQQQQQPPQMAQSGMQQMPQQMGAPPQMQMAQPQMQQQPQMGGPPDMQQMGLQQTGSFGGGTTATVDDAFAGMSNDPVPVDDYSAIGDEVGGGMSTIGGQGMGAMSTIGGFGGPAMSTMGGMPPVGQEVATPEPSPQPVAPVVQARGVIPPPPIHHQQMQHQQQQLPPRSPNRSAPKSPNRSAPKSPRAARVDSNSSADLLSLREAHQKLQAEVISLRAKAASVSEEERETQKEIAQLAGEIGRLSLELSELKEGVMESRIKLTESVDVLKGQMEKKESLQMQVAEARTTHQALTSATEAVNEANELAISQQARAVAAAAAAKEEAESVISPPAPVETADLFGWEAPAAAPMPAMGAPAQEAMPAWGASDAASVQQYDSNPNMAMGASAQEAMPAWGASDAAPVQQYNSNPNMGTESQQPAAGAWGASDAASVQQYDSNPNMSMESQQPAAAVWGASDVTSAQQPAAAAWGASDAASVQQYDSNPNMGMESQQPAAGAWGASDATSVSHSVQSNQGSISNPNPYGGMGGMGAPMGQGGGAPAPLDFMGMGGGMGAPAPQQPSMSPMGGAIPEPGSFDSHSVAPSMAPTPTTANTAPVPATPDRGSFATHAYATAQQPEPEPTPQQQYQPPAPAGPPSPTKAELQSLKGETLKAEKSFRNYSDLIRTISVEVTELESVAKKAEEEMKTLETKTKKGSFGGKKKKAKKEYEKAMELAQQEKSKVKDAKRQLAAAEKEASQAKNQLEEMRQKYEQMELEAATAASYMSVQPSQTSIEGQQYAQQQQQHPGAANQYSDPFGMTGGANQAPAAATSSDSYGMGSMGGGPGGGDYANPFAM